MSERLAAALRKADLALMADVPLEQKVIYLAIAVDHLVGEIMKLRAGLNR